MITAGSGGSLRFETNRSGQFAKEHVEGRNGRRKGRLIAARLYHGGTKGYETDDLVNVKAQDQFA